MPLYEYQCFVCSNRFERIQKVADDSVKDCPSCGGRVRRLLGVPALQFKGSGWYVNDYGKGNGRSKTESEQSEQSEASSGNGKDKAEKSAESKPATTKSEAKKPAQQSS